MKRFAALLLLGAALAGAGATSPRAADDAVVILRATVIDGTGAPPHADQALVVRDGRIAAIGPASAVALPAGARVLDAHGGFLVPGFWDLHVHVLRRERYRTYFPLLVAQGVVGVRDMGGDYDLAAMQRLRAEVENGGRVGPHFLMAGPFVDGPYPLLPRLSRVVSTAAEADALVQDLHRQGADFIKVYNRLPREAYFGIADAARRLGIPFAGHVPFSVSAREAAFAGQISIEHLFNVAFACSSREDELMLDKARALGAGEAGERRRLRRAYLLAVLDSFDPARCAALYANFMRHDTAVAPTLVQRRDFSGGALPVVPAAEFAYVPRGERAGWDASQDMRLQGRDLQDREIDRRYYERDRSLVAPMQAAGVRLLAGTDGGDVYTVPGFSLHEELAALVDAGLTPMQSLQSATRNAAQFLGTPHAFGTIEVGRRADLVLLRQNPLTDIRNTRSIEAVMLAGRWFDRAALDGLMSQAREAAEGTPP